MLFLAGVVGQEFVLQVPSQCFCWEAASASPLRNETASKPQTNRQKAKTKADALKW